MHHLTEKILIVLGKYLGSYIHPMELAEIARELNLPVFYVSATTFDYDYSKGSVGNLRLWAERPNDDRGHFIIEGQQNKLIISSDLSATGLYEVVVKNIAEKFSIDLIVFKGAEPGIDTTIPATSPGTCLLWKFEKKS